MKKKVLLLAYLRKNVGDDLFVSMILEKYKKVEFIFRNIEEEYQEPFKGYNNCTFIKEDVPFVKIDIDKYDACIYIGGSVLFEHDNAYEHQKNITKFAEKCRKKEIPFIYMSSNFGPYKTKKFYDECEKTIKKLDTITFRDKYSYKEFNNIKSVKYAPDLVLNLKGTKRKKIKNSIGISIINLGLKSRSEELKEIENTYYNMYVKNIRKFIDEGKKIYLFSFCDYEGDHKAITKLKELLPQKYNEHVKEIRYKGKEGNLADFISNYSKMEKMICTRFHAVILSLIFEQKFMVLSYSKKIQNTLNDLSTKINVIDLDSNLEKLEINEKMFNSIPKKQTYKYREKAYEHFTRTEEILYKTPKKLIKLKNINIFKRIKRKIKAIKNKIIKKIH